MENVFEKQAARYEQWFEKHAATYQSEVEAVREILPAEGRGLEIGVGSGRFAQPLGIGEGVEPAAAMRRLARERGVDTREGVGEALPYGDREFDRVVMITTICFVEDPLQCCREAWRVLKQNGAFLIGLIDRGSFLGREYERQKEHNVFYRNARFFSVDEIINTMRSAGFADFEFRQTVFDSPARITAPQRAQPGYGDGAFVVVRGAAEKSVSP